MHSAEPATAHDCVWRAALDATAKRVRVAAALLGLLALLAAGFEALAQPIIPGSASEPAQAEETDDDVEALIRVLEDDAARVRLIERLRAASGDAAVEETIGPEETLAGRLAEYTREAAESAAQFFAAMTNVVQHLSELTDGAFAIDFDALERVVVGVALLVAAVLTVYLVLQLLFRRLQRRIAAAAAAGDLIKRVKMIAGSILLDIGTVVTAWAVGYVFALNIGPAQQIGLNQTLFLNAFLLVELIKAASRALLAPRWAALRTARIEDTAAAYWYFWLSRLISLIGYTFLFIAPILAAGVSSDIAEAVRIVVMLTALAIAITVILQNRASVRARLMRRASAGRADPLSRTLATVARVWHVAAIGYLIVVFGLWLSHPQTALPFVLAATWKSIVAVLLGVLVAGFIGRVAAGGMHLPEEVKARLPLLEARLNAFVPGVLRVVRFIVGIAVAVTILEVWDVADIAGWLLTGPGQAFLAATISAALILLAAGVVYVAVQSWVEYRLNPNLGRFVSARERTLLGLFRNAFTVVLAVIVFMLVLSQLGVNIAPLLAGAGVVGLAIGFGAQKLVQDVINGAFIQFENTMNEGDVVQLGGVSGVVERLTIRSVSLRSLDGTYHVIPFSSVDTVSNFMKHFSYHLAAIGVAYRENIADVKDAMLAAFDRLKQTPHAGSILGDFEMQGVVEFASSSIVVRGRIKTIPGKQWEVGRAYNEHIKQVFDERGIEIAFPHMTVYLGEDKDGNAPPLRVKNVPEGGRDEAGTREHRAANEVQGSRAALPADTARDDSKRAARKPVPPGEEADFELEDSATQTEER
jgi:moderate conductance mechanosensitive channel